MFMIQVIGAILGLSIRSLFAQQPDILKNTSQTGMTEWNLSHHLANQIAKYIFWLDCDLDVTKRNYDSHRPDIIFHKRGTNSLNYLVIELKCNNPSEDDIKEDIRKITKDWMAGELRYRFGASVVVRSVDDYEGQVFDRAENPRSFNFNHDTSYVQIPTVSAANKKRLKELVTQIHEVRGENNISPLITEIDSIAGSRVNLAL